jgi:predicted esterase
MTQASTATDPHAGQPFVTAGAPPHGSDLAVVLVHGRNAAPENILELAPALAPGFERGSRITFLAPAAAHRTWYPHSFLAPIDQNEPHLSSALRVLERAVAALVAQGLMPERIVLGGFSQGACLAAEFVVRHPARYGAVLIFSGGLIGPPGTWWTSTGSLAGTPVFLGCSDRDPHIPQERVRESAEVFERLDAEVIARLYPGMGHVVNDDEIQSARSLMTGAISR